MATDYPYVQSISRLSTLFNKIAIVGTPPKVDAKWLSQVGFTTDNDRRLLTTLRHLGFIGSEGKPTDTWTAYRGPNSRAILGNSVKAAYPELFHTYPQAETLSIAELESFIRSSTGLGPKAVELAARTFKALVELSEFNQDEQTFSPASDSEAPSEPEQRVPQASSEKLFESQRMRGSGVVINVNLQLTLPETVDAAVYNALFAALNKHILCGRSADEHRE